MNDRQEQTPWTILLRLATEDTTGQLEEYVEQVPRGELAMALSRLSEDEQAIVFQRLDPETAAGIIEQLAPVQAAAVMECLEPRSAAGILEELPSNDQADLINDLDQEDAEAILREMDPRSAADLRTLAAYEPDTAGGIMVTEFLRYRENMTADEVVRDMRDHADQYGDYDVQYAYVCDQEDRLRGVLRLRDLLLSPRNRSLEELMIADPISVPAALPLAEVAEVFHGRHLLGVPVVDAQQRLIGVVRQTEVSEAEGERDRSDFLKTQGIVSGEEIRTLPLFLRSRRRLAWLSANIVLNVIAASVIALFENTLSAVIALAVFLPIISDMSGCSGNQAVAVSLRELALGLVRVGDVWRVWFQEVSVGLLNGLVLGALIGCVAWLWKGSVYLGIVVGMALFANTVIAVSIGGVVPLTIKRLGWDPAIASGPILTTVTDMCGFFLVLGTATLLLEHLAP